MKTLTVIETVTESHDENGNALTAQEVLERVIFNVGPVVTDTYTSPVFWVNGKSKKECLAKWESFAENTSFYMVGRIGVLDYKWTQK